MCRSNSTKLREQFPPAAVQIGELSATIEDSLLGPARGQSLCGRGPGAEKFEQGNREFEKIKTLGYYAMAAFNTSTRMFDGLMYFVVILAGDFRWCMGPSVPATW